MALSCLFQWNGRVDKEGGETKVKARECVDYFIDGGDEIGLGGF